MLKQIRKYKLWVTIVVLFVLSAAVFVSAPAARAADQTFTVNVTTNEPDDNVGDGICETANPGECTFAAALQEANANVATTNHTINFNIPGAGVHTITPTAGLDYLTEPVLIDGYTQPGSSANTETYPDPNDAVINIAFDLSGLGFGAYIGFDTGASGSVMQGVSMYGKTTGGGSVAIFNSSNISLLGNFFDVEPDGTTPTGTPSYAILSTGTSANLALGGPAPAERNIIASTIYLRDDTTATIENNYIGVDRTGVANTGSLAQGVYLDGNASATVNENVISGFNYGVFLDTTSSTMLIEGNRIGTDYSGTLALGNTTGVYTNAAASSVQIIDNLVSGNTGIGLSIDSPNAVIQGNIIGLTANGTGSLSNGQNGITLSANSDGTVIGGVTAPERNVISQNGSNGIYGTQFDDVTIQGNYIGLDAAGANGLGNTDNGIALDNATNVTIGGSVAGEGNVIGDNGDHGIFLTSVTGAVVQGNLVGLEADGVSALGNNGSGIYLASTTDVLVGGTANGEPNTIHNNSGAGISFIVGTIDNSALGNSIYNNGLIGIDIDGGGVNVNDGEDADVTANEGMNYPSNLTYIESGGNTDVTYDLDVPAGDYRIEFFSNTALDGTGFGEGESYLGSDNITSGGFVGSESFTSTITGDGHANIVATVTEVDGSNASGYGATSEFSDAAELAPPVTDVELTKTLDNPEDVAIGAQLDFTITFTNNGPDDLDIGGLDCGGNPIITCLFIDFLPPDLVPTGQTAGVPFTSSNPDVECTWLGPGSASMAGPLLANHADHSLLYCGFTAGSTILQDGDSISTTLETTVEIDSDLAFTNNALSGGVAGDPDIDMQIFFLDRECPVDPDYDMIECYKTIDNGSRIDNFANTTPFADLTIGKTVSSPASVEPGDTVTYDITITNNGIMGIDLQDFNITNLAPLFNDVYPAGDITFVGPQDPNIFCDDVGPGSNVYLGPAAQDHPDHQLVNCAYNVGAPSNVIGPGQSATVSLDFTLNNGASSTFTNYVLMANAYNNDPDFTTLLNIFQGTTEDVFDTLENPNFARVSFSPTGAAGGDELADTGMDIRNILLIATAIIGWVVPAYVLSRTKNRSLTRA